MRKDKKLRDFWTITSTSEVASTEQGGKPRKFIASIEAKKYPFVGTQFHPEKVTQTWIEDMGIDHSWKSIELNRYFGDQFVRMARVNKNNFGNFKEY